MALVLFFSTLASAQKQSDLLDSLLIRSMKSEGFWLNLQ